MSFKGHPQNLKGPKSLLGVTYEPIFELHWIICAIEPIIGSAVPKNEKYWWSVTPGSDVRGHQIFSMTDHELTSRAFRGPAKKFFELANLYVNCAAFGFGSNVCYAKK